MNDKITFYNADCREILKTFPDNHFDTVITDPPYGINYNKKYDKSNDIFFDIEEELYRVCKPDAWLVFWWSIKKIPDIAKLKLFEYKWQIIAKFQGTVSKSIIGQRFYAPIFVYAKGNPKVKRKIGDEILATELPFAIDEKIRQGDFKPTLTQAYLLDTFAGENKTVLDPFAGFGSLPFVVGLFPNTVKQIICIESDTHRYNVALDIIKNQKVKIHPSEKQKLTLSLW